MTDQNHDDAARNRPGRNDTGQDRAGESRAAESDAAQNGAPPPVSTLDEQLAELEDRWLRAVAELDNLRKRALRDVERQRAEERARVAAEWLPVLDNLELALQHADGDPTAVIEGVRAVRDQAVGVLARLGFPRQDQVGVKFDPKRHEAVSMVADPDAEPGTVIQVLRPGYGDGERQLRPAAVVVATKAD
jgi:molecular chaperone GrpE